MILSDGNVDIKQFTERDHAFFLPDGIDLFEWSLPFVAEKVVSLFAHFLAQ